MAILAYVSGPGGFHRSVTDEDALWSARMLLGEAGHHVWDSNEGYAIMWAMINRWVQTAVNEVLPYMTLGEFEQRYSKAINPAFLQGGSRDTDPDEESDKERDRAARRVLTWRQLDPRLRPVVYNVLTGRVPAGPYAGVVHFGAPTDPTDPRGILTPLPGVGPDSNVFYRLPQTLSWRPTTVTIGPETTVAAVRTAGFGLGVSLVLVAVLLSTQLGHEGKKKKSLRVRSARTRRGHREVW